MHQDNVFSNLMVGVQEWQVICLGKSFPVNCQKKACILEKLHGKTSPGKSRDQGYTVTNEHVGETCPGTADNSLNLMITEIL